MKPLKKPCRDRGNRLDQLISADKTIGTEIGTDFLSSNIKWVYYRTNKNWINKQKQRHKKKGRANHNNNNKENNITNNNNKENNITNAIFTNNNETPKKTVSW